MKIGKWSLVGLTSDDALLKLPEFGKINYWTTRVLYTNAAENNNQKTHLETD